MGSVSVLRQSLGIGTRRRSTRERSPGRMRLHVVRVMHGVSAREARGETGSSGTAHVDCGGFHTTRARLRDGTPLSA